MFSIINNIKGNKKGFTLTEVLVTLTILLIALTLMCSLMFIVIRNYSMVEYTWLAQTMADYLTQSLTEDAGLEALSTADYADLMNEVPTLNSSNQFTLSSCPELGTITYNSEKHELTFNPSAADEEYKDTLKNKKYIYYITFDEHLYRVHYGQLVDIGTKENPGTMALLTPTVSTITKDLGLITEDQEKEIESKTKIEFSVARKAGQYIAYDEDISTATKYLDSGVTADITVKVTNKRDAGITSTAQNAISVDLMNIGGTNKVNYKQGGEQLSNSYVTGWTPKDPKNVSTVLEGIPDTETLTAAGTELSKVVKSANIVRYHSVNTEALLSDSTQSGQFNASLTMPICLFVSLTIGSDRQAQILEPIRDFRDTYLRGNAVGEWVIDKYYAWSPALITATEKSPVLKGVFKAVAEGIAVVATVAVE